MWLLWHRREKRQRRMIFLGGPGQTRGAKVDEVKELVNGRCSREVSDVDCATCGVGGCGESSGRVGACGSGGLCGGDVEVEGGHALGLEVLGWKLEWLVWVERRGRRPYLVKGGHLRRVGVAVDDVHGGHAHAEHVVGGKAIVSVVGIGTRLLLLLVLLVVLLLLLVLLGGECGGSRCYAAKGNRRFKSELQSVAHPDALSQTVPM